MRRKKFQRDKALYSNKKIWAIHIHIKEHCKTEMESRKDGKWTLVYVVDNSMARAIQKAVYHFGRTTGIKFLRKKEYWEHDILKIGCRRASKIEIVNTRAGMGIKMCNGNVMEVI